MHGIHFQNKLQAAAMNNPELKNKTIEEGDLYSSVCGEKEPAGRVRVIGLGPTPQDIGTPGAKSYKSTRLQIEIEARRQADQKVELLTGRVDQMQQELNEMKKLMLAVQGSNSQHGSNSHRLVSVVHALVLKFLLIIPLHLTPI